MYNIQGKINQNVAFREAIQKSLDTFAPVQNQTEVSSATFDLTDISEPAIPPNAVAGSTVNSTISIDCVVSVVANTTSVVRALGKSGEVDFEHEYSPAIQNTSLTLEAECMLTISSSGYDLLEFDLLDQKLTVGTPTGCALRSITLKR